MPSAYYVNRILLRVSNQAAKTLPSALSRNSLIVGLVIIIAPFMAVPEKSMPDV